MENIKEKRHSLKTNAIFNGLYQILVLLAPILTTPYISRIFGAEIIGDYSYYYSILGYFTLVAAFGFSDYGTKIIAENRDDIKKRSQLFWEIMVAKGFISFLCLVAYVITSIFLFKDNQTALYIFLAMTFYIVSILIDPTFFFQGDEDFVSISIRNSLMRILTIILIFVCVRSSNDIVIYALILSLGNLFASGIIYFSFKGKHISKYKIKISNVLRHIKDSFPFFIPALAVTLFTSLNQTLLGVLGNNSAENGYFSQGMKIQNLLSSLAGSLSVIMLSRMSYLLASNDKEQIRVKTIKTFEAFWSVTMPMTFGICVIAPLLIPLFLGNGYNGAIAVVILSSPCIILSPLNGLFGSLYYRPRNKIWIQTLIILGSSIFNIVLSLILIPKYLAIGAVIARFGAEVIQLPFLIYYSKKDLSVSTVFSSIIKPFDNSLIMFIIVYLENKVFSSIMQSNIVLLFIEIMTGGIVYLVLAILTKDTFITGLIKVVLFKIKKIFSKKGMSKMNKLMYKIIKCFHRPLKLTFIKTKNQFYYKKYLHNDKYKKKFLDSLYEKEKFFNKYFLRRYSKILKMDFKNEIDVKTSKPYIFTFWFQGESQMPNIVRECIESTKKNSNNYEYILLSKDNYMNFVEIPNFIKSKFESGRLSIQNFADYLRIKLLAKYDCLWIDATIFTIKEIPFEYASMPFFSIKSPQIYDGKKEYCLYPCFKFGQVYLLGGTNKRIYNQIVFVLEEYLRKYDYFWEYFFIYYIFQFLYIYDKKDSILIDQLKPNNEHIEDYFYYRNNKYDKKYFSENDVFAKLSYKIDVSKSLSNKDSLLYNLLYKERD